ncbi:hypothetical protein D3C87_817110 [compost metagenome]
MGSQNDDRCSVVAPAQGLQKGDAFAIRQAHVEQDQAITHGQRRRHGVAQRLEPVNSVTRRGDVVSQRFPQHMIVFNKQNPQDSSLYRFVLRISFSG